MHKADAVKKIPLTKVSAEDIDFVTPPEHLSAFKFALFGFVEKVKDGDTIAVRSGDGTLSDVRLHGIDAPEDGQEFGERATSLLS